MKFNKILWALLFVNLFLIGDSFAKIVVDSSKTRIHDAILPGDVAVELPTVVIQDISSTITLRFVNPNHLKLIKENNRIIMLVNSKPVTIQFDNGVGVIEHYFVLADAGRRCLNRLDANLVKEERAN